MIARKEILLQINRFYDKITELEKAIDSKCEKTEERGQLSFRYFQLTNQIGSGILFAVEKLKDQLDDFDQSCL